MLEVVSMEQATSVIEEQFHSASVQSEQVALEGALGRVLSEAPRANEDMPPFNRSMVDGYAVIAADTFGSSNVLPAILTLAGQVLMGQSIDDTCKPGTCIAIPTGGMVPNAADAVVMIEHTEDFGDGTIGIQKAAAPGDNIIFQADEVTCGQDVLDMGTRLAPHHIAALATLGIEHVSVRARPRVGIISTGDEIVDISTTPQLGQMRDANGPLLASAVAACGGTAIHLGISPDEAEALDALVEQAQQTCDMVLVSGGSSVGQRDNTADIFQKRGTILFHGIAMKPGKPTICATLNGTPAFGLPGHPLAAYFVFLEFVAPLIARTSGTKLEHASIEAMLGETVPSNHGRSECIPVRLEQGSECIEAYPIRNKSGLITLLSRADGYFIIPRDQEGYAAGTTVSIKPFQESR